MARKNGKTTLLAGIGCYMLFADGESGAEVYSCATTRDQARECFGTAQEMVRRCSLSRRAKVFRSAGGSISYEATGSVFKPLSSDANTLDGKNASCTIVDEFHAHKTDEVYAVMKSSMGARRQPLLCIITTAGFNLAGPCFTYRVERDQDARGDLRGRCAAGDDLQPRTRARSSRIPRRG